MRILLQNGARADIGDMFRETALHVAASGDCILAALLLIENGAPLSSYSKYGRPLRLNIQGAGTGHIMAALIVNGALVNEKLQHDLLTDGKWLCPKAFIEDFREKIKQAIKQASTISDDNDPRCSLRHGKSHSLWTVQTN